MVVFEQITWYFGHRGYRGILGKHSGIRTNRVVFWGKYSGSGSTVVVFRENTVVFEENNLVLL